MLRLCLTVSVLFVHSFAANPKFLEGVDFCEGEGCPEPIVFSQYNNYEEIEYPGFKWILTEVHGTDLKSIVATGLERLFKYSRFANAADTIVPITAPWGVIGSLVNGTIQPEFRVFVFLASQLTSSPEPMDPTVKLDMMPIGWYYIRAFDTKVDEQQYEGRVLEFMKDLEDDKRSFDSSTFYITWFNRDGLIALTFQKKEE